MAVKRIRIKLLPTTITIWSHWCPVCKAASPDKEKGYLCDRCKRVVCSNCLYRYGSGFICGICAKSATKLELLQPLNLNVVR